MAGDVDEAATATVTDEQTTPAARAQKTRQWNKHAVKQLEGECEQLRQAMLKTGFTMDLRHIQETGIVHALCRLLVNRGIASEDEINGEMLSYVKQVLLAGLQQAEEQRLQAAKAQLAVAKRPDLMVARH